MVARAVPRGAGRTPAGQHRPPRSLHALRARRRPGHRRQRDARRALQADRRRRRRPTRPRRTRARSGLALTFDDAPELQYLDEKRMGKVYVAAAADEAKIPVYGQLGLDVMSPAFTPRGVRQGGGAAPRPGARVPHGQARAGVGRQRLRRRDPVRGAHAPEDLLQQAGRRRRWTRCTRRSGRCCATRSPRSARRDEPIDVKVRDFLKVRGRDGKPCLVCGTTIRAVRVGDGDACFCPSCQPETRKLFVNWSASAHTGKSRPPSRR